MDVFAMILAALVGGATAATKDIASDTVKEGYQRLRALVQSVLRNDDGAMQSIERMPQSREIQQALLENLRNLDTQSLQHVAEAAQALLLSLNELPPSHAQLFGIDLEKIKVGSSLRIENVVAAQGAVRLREAYVDGDLSIEGVRAGVPTGKKL